ncbi:hypothetical protein HHK36_001840 [Tetracentron sinense]|uniref:C3H1-type domain-containing protein n=1 Tax=Tetracentron sinense TaxID=13715 RepID=A0A834ZUR9_TETSI|nr:hypothetical protein HHK36_001840 [Tetracentron sinense]
MPSSSAASSEDDDMPATAESSDTGSDSEAEINTEGNDDEGIEEDEEEEEQEEEEQEDAAADEDRNDFSQDFASEAHDEDLSSGSSTPQNSEESLPSGARDIEDSGKSNSFNPLNELVATQKEVSYVKGGHSKSLISGKHLGSSEDNRFQESPVDNKDSGALPAKKAPVDVDKDHGESRSDSETHLYNNDSLEADNTKTSNANGKEVAAEALISHDSSDNEAKCILNSEEKSKQMDMESREDLKQRASSLVTPLLRPRSLSPGAELEDRSKRPAILCDFFARGWCIKGSSCRFLHQKDGVDATDLCTKGDVAVAKRGDVQVDAGLRQDTETSKLSSFPEPLVSAVENNPSLKPRFPSERVLTWEHGESQRFHEENKLLSLQRDDLSSGAQNERGSTSLVHCDFQHFPFAKDDPRLTSSFKDIGRENRRQNLCLDDYRRHASPVIKGDFSKFDIRGRGWPANPSEFQQTSSSIGEEYNRPLGNSLHYENRNPLYAVTGMSPSHHTFSWLGSSSSHNFSSLSAMTLGAQKLLESDRGYHASRSVSLPRSSSSPFSGSEPENLLLGSVPGDPTLSAGHRKSNAWEPSVPFRPSFYFAPPSISSPRSQYDPLLDSIELPGGDKSHWASPFSHGATIQNASYQQTNGDAALTGTLSPEYNAGKHSISSRLQTHGSVSDKNTYTYGTVLHLNEADTTGTSVADWQHRSSMPREEKPLGPAHVVDITKTSEMDLDCNPRHQSEGGRHKKELKADRVRHNNEMDLDRNPTHHTDLVIHNKESKALKLFRAALVDFVKELVKPSWREGHLSKDAHKTIVKKAVDKVLSTLQPHQFPSTMESMKQYLSSSRPKIAKLVEGYVDKYAKS